MIELCDNIFMADVLPDVDSYKMWLRTQKKKLDNVSWGKPGTIGRGADKISAVSYGEKGKPDGLVKITDIPSLGTKDVGRVWNFSIYISPDAEDKKLEFPLIEKVPELVADRFKQMGWDGGSIVVSPESLPPLRSREWARAVAALKMAGFKEVPKGQGFDEDDKRYIKRIDINNPNGEPSSEYGRVSMNVPIVAKPFFVKPLQPEGSLARRVSRGQR